MLPLGVARKFKNLSTEYYSLFFDQTANTGFNGWLFNFTHKKLEVLQKDYNTQKERVSLNVLEVGAGSGQHLPFVKNTYDKYTLVDINSALLPRNNHDTRLKKLEFKLADVENLPFRQGLFDRVISTCLLHHLDNVEDALLERKRVTKIGGLVSIYLSCDPGIINRILRRLLIIPKARKLGFLDYELFIAREHKNHFSAINTLIHHTFKGQHIKVKFYPFGIKSWNLNTFCVFQIQICS